MQVRVRLQPVVHTEPRQPERHGPGCDYRLWPKSSDGNPYWQQTRRDCRYAYFWQYGECLMPSGTDDDYTAPLHSSCGDPTTSLEGQGFRLDVASATAAGVAKL